MTSHVPDAHRSHSAGFPGGESLIRLFSFCRKTHLLAARESILCSFSSSERPRAERTYEASEGAACRTHHIGTMFKSGKCWGKRLVVTHATTTFTVQRPENQYAGPNQTHYNSPRQAHYIPTQSTPVSTRTRCQNLFAKLFAGLFARLFAETVCPDFLPNFLGLFAGLFARLFAGLN